ncbi:MAG TPA: glycosyltransferase [Pyrinomonadaceae bacterium]|nr:glycosyltransferase [Pyrinomonadaceae bacterium]
MRISVVVNTKNEEQTLDRCLTSAAWADEIVVLDMSSDDETVAVARKYTDKVFSCPDFGYVEPARNLAISHATGDWVFILDADEVIPARLAASVKKIVAESEDYALVAIPRRNYIGDYLIRNSGWEADHQPRLFRRGRVRWTDAIHAWPEVDGEVKFLNPDSGFYIKHYNYDDLTDFVARLNRYTSVEAAAFAQDGEWPNWQSILREVVEEFGKRYTPKEDGFYSLSLAGCMAFYRFISHCKRLEQIRAAEGDLIFPLPGSLEEIVLEAVKYLPQNPLEQRDALVRQESLEELRLREEEWAAAREVYEAQINSLTEELTSARTVYETQIGQLDDELTKARTIYEAQIAAQDAQRAADAARILELTAQMAEEQEAHQAQMAEEQEAHQAQAAHQANELDALAARLSDRESQLEQQAALLVALRSQSDKKDEVLEWIQTSRSWQFASTLRRWGGLKHRLRQHGLKLGRRVHLPVQPIFYGLIEAPTDAANVAGELEIHGWVFSTDAPIVRVEAFVDDFYLGRLNYGLKRDDVAAAYPSLARADCGYSERITLRSSMVGRRTLIVRAYDAHGHVQIFTRLIAVGSPKTMLNAVNADVPANGNGARSSVAADAVQAAASANGTDASFYRRLEALIDDFKSRTEREPSILNWHTGLNLAAALPHLAVFSPPTANGHYGLPYLDHSVDIVVVPASDSRHLAEAHRVAAVAVVQAHGTEACAAKSSSADAKNGSRIRLVPEWKEGATAETTLPSASIIIPVHNKVDYTEKCLEQLLQTLPPNFRGEIIVVDDASTDETPAALLRWTQADARIRVLRNEQNKGFIGSCNAGAEAAHADVLVFLNNDTLPQPGWLPPLLRVLRERPDAGAVGGKLIYPDGTLQEAGGIIFSDGSGCNFGRNDKAPNAPLYNFLREVDYCSGALLATPRTLFLSLGGFDSRYAPAYYEDTDYCFSLREMGRKVYYQPESVIIHFEGVSSGTDLKRGVKSFQTVNRVKFVEKWQHVLRRQPSAPNQYDFATLHALSVHEEKRDAD